MRAELFLGVVLLVSGCGYTLGYRLPEGVFRLAVPTFRNETFPLRREIEQELTRAVRRELELRTDANLVESRRADAVLEGTVLSFQEAVVTEGARDVATERSIEVVTRIRVFRTKDGTDILNTEIRDHETFSVFAGETQEDARARAVRKIAERIVVELEAWPLEDLGE